MRWLNYHHLFYFLTVAQTGSVTAAARKLRLAQPTVSAQIKSLEDMLGQKLFERQGRSLVPTETGKLVKGYAEQIFSLGNELFRVIDGESLPATHLLKVGFTDMLPKHIAFRLIDPLYQLDRNLKIAFFEDTPERLLAMLATQEIDVIIADSPIPPQVKVKAYNHLLGESGTSMLAAAKLAQEFKRHFPQSLSQAPLLAPSPIATLRRELDAFFQTNSIYPAIVGEFQDSALMKIFAKSGRGLIPVPTAVEKEVCTEYNLKVVGRMPAVKERFFLISPERRLTHPAVTMLHASAQRNLFLGR